MSGGRAARLVVKEGDLFLYTNALGQAPGSRELRARSVLPRHALPEPARADARGPPAGPALVHRRAGLRRDRRAHQPRGAHAGRAHAAAGHRARAPHPLSRRPAATSCCACATTTTPRSTCCSTCTSTPTSPTSSRCAACGAGARGTRFAPKADGDTLTLAYHGLDDVLRKTVVTFEEPPESIKQGRARYRLRLAPGERAADPLRRAASSAPDAPPSARDGDLDARSCGAVRHEHERWEAGATDIFTDNEQVNAVAAARPGRPAHAGRDRRRRACCRWPACPGSRRPSAASCSWSASRRCSSTCAGRRRAVRYLAGTRDATTAPSARSSRARSCTSCAAASWPACAPSRTRRTSARSTRRRSACCWSAS